MDLPNGRSFMVAVESIGMSEWENVCIVSPVIRRARGDAKYKEKQKALVLD